MQSLLQAILNIQANMGNAAAAFRETESNKIMVLGCMGAGKSTFLRQMCKLYPPRNFTTRRRNPQYYVYCIQLNLLNIFRELKNLCTQLEVPWDAFRDDFEVIDVYRHRELFPKSVCEAIMRLKGSGLYETCRMRQRVLQLPQNYNFFIQRTEQFMDEKYIPSENEIMMSYSQTIGHNFETITCFSKKFDFLEMPGHHIWRQRWAEYFADTKSVVFVIDLSELCDPAFYDQGHLENKTRTVFTELVNHELLQQVVWLLFFNKVDTFNDHAAGFDFKRLANHLDTADSAKTFYRSQFTTLIPRDRCYAHMVSLVSKDSTSTLTDMMKKIARHNFTVNNNVV